MRRILAAFALTLMSAAAVMAQGTPSPASKIPIRQLAPPDAKTREPLKLVIGLVQFNDGHVLVNDVIAQRLLFFDRSLTGFKVTADTMHAGAPTYTRMGGGFALFKYLGDSAAFVDAATLSFIIIGPNGTLGRAMAHANPMDMYALSLGYSSGTAFDARGRFVYRARGSGGISATGATDTARLVRADLDARRVDTVATFTLPHNAPQWEIFKDDQGKTVAFQQVNPAPPGADEWAVLSDGSIAVVRSHDYHIDWLYPDGTTASTPKMSFDWRRLTDADKQAKIDSARHIIDSINATGRRFSPITFTCAAGPRGESNQAHGERCIAERNAGKSKLDTVYPTITFPPLSELTDYIPAIRPGAVKADRDNHLWILPTTSLSAVGGGLLYDVVNRQGVIIERVQLPPGRSIVGFGPNGVVYLQSGDRNIGFIIERTHVVRATPGRQ